MMFPRALLLGVVVAGSGAACAPVDQGPRDAAPCSSYLPLAWRDETVRMEGSNSELGYVQLDLSYRGLVQGREDYDVYGFEEQGTAANDRPWDTTRLFACQAGRTDAIRVLDDCTFPEPVPLAWDDMEVGWTGSVDLFCEEIWNWHVTGELSVPDCDVRETPGGTFETCTMRWDLTVDFQPDRSDDVLDTEVVQWSMSKNLGPVWWNTLVLTDSSLIAD